MRSRRFKNKIENRPKMDKMTVSYFVMQIENETVTKLLNEFSPILDYDWLEVTSYK